MQPRSRLTKTATNDRRRLAATGLLILLLAPCLAQGHEKRRVLVHSAGRLSGDLNPVWLAAVDRSDSAQEISTVFLREKLMDARWQRLGSMPAAVIGLSAHSTESVVLLGNHTWAWFSTSRFSYGPQLPDGARMISIAGDRKTLWAIGLRGSAPTAPAPTTAAGVESPGQAVAVPVLHQFRGGSWAASAAPWPADPVKSRPTDLSLAVIDGLPHLALAAGLESITLYSLTEKPEQWRVLDQVKVRATTRHFKLLGLGNRPALWLQADHPTGEIHVGGKVIPLMLPGEPPQPEEVDVTADADQIRMVLLRGTSLMEARFSFDGQPQARDPRPVAFNEVQATPSIELITTAVFTVLLILIISSLLRRRQAARDEDRSDQDD